MQPTQIIIFLGFVLNSQNMTIRLTNEKAKEIKQLCCKYVKNREIKRSKNFVVNMLKNREIKRSKNFDVNMLKIER